MSGIVIDHQELVITFSEEDHEKACQSVEPCPKVALWIVTFENSCKCRPAEVAFCQECKDVIIMAAEANGKIYLRYGFVCAVCRVKVGKIVNVRPLRS